MNRSRYIAWTLDGPHRKPTLLQRVLRELAKLVGVG